MDTDKDNHLSLPANYVDEYWELVRRVLSDIYFKSPDDADVLREELNNLPLSQQELFYHGEALYVASDLADKEPSEPQIAQYMSLRSKIYRLPS